ncbi:MAG: hypothetical protein ACI9AR_000553 [Flavobacteriaceae bacterium]
MKSNMEKRSADYKQEKVDKKQHMKEEDILLKKPETEKIEDKKNLEEDNDNRVKEDKKFLKKEMDNLLAKDKRNKSKNSKEDKSILPLDNTIADLESELASDSMRGSELDRRNKEERLRVLKKRREEENTINTKDLKKENHNELEDLLKYKSEIEKQVADLESELASDGMRGNEIDRRVKEDRLLQLKKKLEKVIVDIDKIKNPKEDNETKAKDKEDDETKAKDKEDKEDKKEEKENSKELLGSLEDARKRYAGDFERNHREEKKNKKTFFSKFFNKKKKEAPIDAEDFEKSRGEYFTLRKEHFKAQLQEKRSELEGEGFGLEAIDSMMIEFKDKYSDDFIKNEDDQLDTLRWESMPKKERGFLEKVKRSYDTASPLKKKLIAFGMVTVMGAAGAMTAGAAFGVGASSIAGIMAAKTGWRASIAVAGSGLGQAAHFFGSKKNRLSKQEQEMKNLREKYKNTPAGINSSDFQEAVFDLREQQNKKARKSLLMKSGLAFGFGTLAVVDMPDFLNFGEGVSMEDASQTNIGEDITITEVPRDIVSHSVPASSKGSIQTILDLKAQYTPENMPNVLKGDASDIAEKAGLYKPDVDNESSIIQKGDIFEIDTDGDLRLVHNDGRVDELINFDGKIDTDATSQSYRGKFFDYDKSGTDISSGKSTDWKSVEDSVSGGDSMEKTTDWKSIEESVSGGDSMEKTTDWKSVEESVSGGDPIENPVDLKSVEESVSGGDTIEKSAGESTVEGGIEDGVTKEVLTSSKLESSSIYSTEDFIEKTGYSDFSGLDSTETIKFQENYNELVQGLFGEEDILGERTNGFLSKEWSDVKNLSVSELAEKGYDKTDWYKRLQMQAFSASYMNPDSTMKFTDALGGMIKQYYV